MMKTKLFVLILCFMPLFIQEIKAQAAVVDAPHTLLNGAEWLANVKKWSSQINEMIDAQKLRENLQNINQLKQLKSLMELADLLDDLACLTSDYNFYLNVGTNYHCLKFLNFQRLTVNMNLATDLLFKVATVTTFFSMNSEGRMSFVEQVKQSVEIAAKEMQSFNETVRSNVITKALKSYSKKSYLSGYVGVYNRYTN